MTSTIKQALSPKAIFIAIGGACLVYAGMLGLTFMNGGATLEQLEDNMAAQSIAFEAADVVEEIEPLSLPLELQTEHAQHHESSDYNDKVTAEDLPPHIEQDNSPLPPAPYEGLTEENAAGALPIIGKNNLKPFDAYKKPFILDVKKPTIAIGVKGVGLLGSSYQGAIDALIPNVSLILSPYADDINALQKSVRAQGFETWLELPLENKNFPYADPGPRGILALAGLKFNQTSYRSVLAETSGYTGIAVYSDSAFLNAQPMLSGILSDAFIRGLGIVEMNSGRDAMSISVAIKNGAPHAAVSMKDRDETFAKKFAALKKTATRNKSAVGVIEITPLMLAQFKTEVLKAQKEGFEIAPLSTVADVF